MTLFLGVGQCGNQVAEEFFALAEQEYDIFGPSYTLEGRAACLSRSGKWFPNAEACPLFAGDGLAHLVSVDSEPKVVQSLQDRYHYAYLPPFHRQHFVH